MLTELVGFHRLCSEPKWRWQLIIELKNRVSLKNRALFVYVQYYFNRSTAIIILQVIQNN